MTQIRVDNSVTEIQPTAQKAKVGDLLKNIHSSLPETRVITKVFLDGRPLSSEENAMEKDLDLFQEMEIRTVDKMIWAQTGLDVALSCLERVQTSLIRTAELFRDSDKGRANRFFAQCIEGLERFLESITITRSVLNLKFETITLEGRTLAQIESYLSQILKSVLESQEKKNFEELADKIEYELITNLSSWKTALTQIRTNQESNS